MKRSALIGPPVCLALLVASAFTTTGCHSYHIETTIRNNTGATISLLEVDYPTASFGTDSLGSGSDYHYRIQTRGSGSIKVQYTGPGGKQIQITGPTLQEKQEGSLEIDLLPGGKAEFNSNLHPKQ